MWNALKRLSLAVTVMLLLTSCGTASSAKCTLPQYPSAPAIAPIKCDFEGQPYVCFTIQEIVDLGIYIRDAESYARAAELCRRD